jgi:predicted nuclease of predicted toxin-antitoxin system
MPFSLPPKCASWWTLNCRPLSRAGSASADFLLRPCELGLRESDDGSIWNFATEGGWTVITKDEDFVARCVGNPVAPAVVWLRLGNCTIRVLFAWLEPFLPEILRRLSDGEKLIEVR